MPIITATYESQQSSPSSERRWLDTALNMATAISKVVGSECKLDEKTATSAFERYYVSMGTIGYTGWCISVTGNHLSSSSTANNSIRIEICTLKDDGTPKYSDDDQNVAGSSNTGKNSYNSVPYTKVTCVMMFDDNKDTVLFDVHPGETTYGTDIVSSADEKPSFEIFFAKDVNGEVLCGVGGHHIYSIRTKDRMMKDQDKLYYATPPRKSSGADESMSSFLLLTKMVNYLSPGYPEMKSAYISVIRPYFEYMSGAKYLNVFYADGKRWGRAGYSDSIIPSDSGGNMSYFPIEPFVNY